MQQDFAELTVFAVENVYGPLTACVYSTLAYYGRQPLQDIAQKTLLPLSQVRSTLVVLVQNHLVLYSYDDKGIAHYSANENVAYNMAFRYGKFSRMVHRRLGSAAVEVFLKIATLGHARISDVVEAFGFVRVTPNGTKKDLKQSQSESVINGTSDENQGSTYESAVKSLAHVHHIVDRLLKFGYLCLVSENDYKSTIEIDGEARDLINSNYNDGKPKGKDKAPAEQSIDQLKREWRDAAFCEVDDSERPLKRQKVDGLLPNGVKQQEQHPVQSDDDLDNPEFESKFRIKENLIMRLNFDKCTVFLRNQQLVKLAHRYIGETTSKVFEALLESFESFLLRCYDPMDSSTALQSPFESTETGMLYSTAQNIIKYLEPGLDLNIGLPLATTTNGVNGHVSSNNESRKHVSKQPSSSTADNDNDSDTPINPLKRKAPDQTEADSVLKLEGHLKLLQSDPRHFVIRRSSGWTVPFKALTRTLMQAEIETTITARFGPVSARLIRILHTTYAADEKALAASAILKPKEVRATTNALLAAGLLATQEIPRDSNRTTNRLLWLYAYDPAAARRALLADAFRAMTRLLRRADAESGRVAPLLLKAERTDVVGHEEKYLTQEERRELMRLSETEMDLLASVGRIDDLVACLRDFAPLDDPFVGNRTRPEGDEMDDDE